MRLTTKVYFISEGFNDKGQYKIDKYGARIKEPIVVHTSYVLQSESNTNRNLWQYSAFRDAQLTRFVVRDLPSRKWEYIRIKDKNYRVVYIQSRGRKAILTAMEKDVRG